MKLSFLLVLLFSFTAATTTYAEDFISKDSSDEQKVHGIKKLLGPYPVIGSPESNKDFEILHELQNSRTEADCARAKIEEHATLKTFFVEVGGLLSEKEYKKMKVVLAVPFVDFLAYAGISKQMFKRPRPYVTSPDLSPCVRLSKTWAYPSGHTAMARMYARILGKFYPDRKAAFLKRGDEVAFDRVMSGLHHPSDVAAGKKLGDAIADHYMNSDDFKKHMESLQ